VASRHGAQLTTGQLYSIKKAMQETDFWDQFSIKTVRKSIISSKKCRTGLRIIFPSPNSALLIFVLILIAVKYQVKVEYLTILQACSCDSLSITNHLSCSIAVCVS
jgi:hypothetical protein